MEDIKHKKHIKGGLPVNNNNEYETLFQNAQIKNGQCAPNVEFSGNSCYPLEVIEEMFDLYYNDSERNNKDDKVKISFNNNTVEVSLKDLKEKEIYINYINDLKKDDKQYKTFLVNLLSQIMILDKNKVNNNKKNKPRNMQKHYNWLLIPSFKALRNNKDLKKLYFNTNKSNNNKLINTQKVLEQYFRPFGPSNNNNWLSNFNIEEVLKQYEQKYPDFIMLGAVPRDFKTIEYCKEDYTKEHIIDLIKKGKRRFGSVFNLDLSYQSGSHWVSMFVDINKGQIYYIDSVGKKPQDEFVELMDLFEEIIKSINKNIKIDKRIGTMDHQHKNTECGVYSIFFIVSLLNGKSFDYLNKKRTPDELVQKYRKVFFNEDD